MIPPEFFVERANHPPEFRRNAGELRGKPPQVGGITAMHAGIAAASRDASAGRAQR
jgi:hypothetical protein